MCYTTNPFCAGAACSESLCMNVTQTEIGPITNTTDPEKFKSELRELYVQGGGDCPEMSVGAIKMAVEVSRPGSFIYVFTDARAKDYRRKQEVLQLLQLKQSQVVFVLTGDCGDRTHPGYTVYEEIAATSSGQIFHLDKQQVNEVLKWVEEAIQASKVHLLSTDHESAGEKSWDIPFDPSLKEVTISLSGPEPHIHVADPSGKVLSVGRGLEELLSIPNSALVLGLKPAVPGVWTIKIGSSGRHTVRVTGVSTLDFRTAFSTSAVMDPSRVTERPLQGIPISALINCTGLSPPGQLESLDLLRVSGESVLSLPAQRLPYKRSKQLWSVPQFQAPKESFFVQVNGTDRGGHQFQRLSNVAYTSIRPDCLLVAMPPHIQGINLQSLSSSCSVCASDIPSGLRSISDDGKKSRGSALHPPPTISLLRNVTASLGDLAVLSCHVLGEIRYNLSWTHDRKALTGGRLRILPNSSLEIQNVQPGDAGQYQCTASNDHGTTTASVWLSVLEPPHIQLESSAPHLSQGEEVKIRCEVSGHPAPHISWKHGDTFLRNGSRHIIIDHGTLLIKDAGQRDAGNYSCVASNGVGTDEQFVSLAYMERPKATAVRSSVQVPVGEDAVLECVTVGLPPPLVTWYQGDQELTVATSDVHRGTLRLQGVKADDAGDYTCVASNEAGSSSDVIRVDVGTAPQFTDFSLDVDVEVGESAMLSCSAEGNPTPQVTWSRQDEGPVVPSATKEVIENPGSNILHFKIARPEDAAVYVCEAWNAFGWVQAEILLNVTGLVTPKVAVSPPVVTVLEGHPVSLPCTIMAGNPLPVQRWTKDLGELQLQWRHSMDGEGGLHIEPTLREDAGKYICEVTNAAGSANHSLLLHVHVAPTILPWTTEYTTREGMAITLSCEAKGHPPPVVTWTKGKEVLTPESFYYHVNRDGSLLIPLPSGTDAGHYTCTATSQAGVTSKETLLFVHTKPRISVNGSHDQSVPVRVVAALGMEVTLPCEVQGNPLPVVSWRKDSLPLPIVSTRHHLLPSWSLRVSELRVMDSGYYTCLASNPAGNTSLTYRLEVQVPPRVHPGPKVLKALLGRTLALPCVAHGDPMPRLSWYKDGVALRVGDQDSLQGPDGTISVLEVQLSDSGSYRCVASSSAGEDSLEFRLEVLGTPLPLIRWLKNGVVLTGSQPGMVQLGNGSLLIELALPSHSGDYICLATNEAGSARRKTKLVVYAPPRILEDGQGQNISMMANQPLTLGCEVTGVPFPTVTWSKDGRMLTDTPGLSLLAAGQSLRFHRIRKDNSGSYTCRAVNQAGEAQRTFNVVVLVPPTIYGAGTLQEVTVRNGLEVELQCRVSGTPAPQVEWTKDGQPLSPGDPHIQLLEGGQLLRMNSTRLADQGRYQCLAFNHAGQQVKDFNLKIYSKRQKVVSMLHGAVELKCEARGSPSPSITWFKDKPPIVSSSRATYRDTWREETVLHYSVTVLVPSKVLIGDGSAHVTVTVDDPLDLSCHVTGFPAPRVWWSRNGHPIGDEEGVDVLDGGRMLTISQIQPGHAGSYVCKADGEAGDAEAAVNVSVQELPMVSIAGGNSVSVQFLESVVLECDVSGSPSPSVHWWKDGSPLPVHGTTLQIDSISIDDEGVYSCVATNPAGEGRQDVILTVLVPPNIEPTEVNQTVVENLPASFECLASGSPMPVVSWYRGEQLLTAMPGITLLNEGRTLQIERARGADRGEYRCVASNAVGRSEFQYHLQVYVPPRIVSVTDLATTLVNEQVWLECNVTGAPEPAVMWLKEQVPVSTARAGLQILEQGRLLSLSAAQVSDSGRYTCVAVNPAGEDSRDTELQVYVPPSILGEELNSSVTIHQPVVLECQSNAIPPPNISWLKDGRPLLHRHGVRVTENGRYLQIEQTQLRDAGRYTCEASNDAGRSEKHYNVIIKVPPSFPASPAPHLSVIEGQSVSLTCECHGVPAPTLTWTKNGSPLVTEDSGLSLVSAGGRLLHIGEVQASDEGSYTCACSNEAGSSTREHWLEVYALPVISGSGGIPKGLTVTRDSHVSMECMVSGKPRPSVTWLKDGYPVGSGTELILHNRGQQLSISRAQPSHSGRYVCVAVNAAGQTDMTFELSVQVPPEIPETQAEPFNVSVTLHGTLTLTCEASGIPPPVMAWHRNNVPLTPGENIHLQSGGRVLKLAHVQIQDGGLYTCLATNAAGQGRKDFVVDILVPPSMENEEEDDLRVPEGQSVHLHCRFTGHPKPRITWFRDSKPLQSGDGIKISHDGSELSIQRAGVFNTGHYTCLATNSIAERSRHFILTILVSPTIPGALDDGSMEDVIVLINNPLSLICEAVGFPAPTVTWLKDGEPFKESHNLRVLPGGHGLQIRNAQEDDAGEYTCLVTNEVGEASKNYEVKVFIPPQITRDDLGGEFGVKEIKTKVNSSLTLHCESRAVPKPKHHWYKEGQLLESFGAVHILGDGQVLQIHPVRISDSGRYTCVATNVAGEDEREFNLNVQVPPIFHRPGSPSAAFELAYREDEEEELTEHREVVATNPISLYCDTNAIPPPALTWYKDGQPISASDGVLVLLDGRILQIPMARAEHAGKYTCEATNEAGEDRLHYELLVLTPPVMVGEQEDLIQVTVLVNQTAELDCEASGVPPPTIIWLKNGLTLSTTDRYQILEEGRRLQLSDQGTYMCKAHNPAGSDEKVLHLSIYVPISITHPQNETIQLTVGNSIVLSCEAEGSPPPKFTWLKDGAPLEHAVEWGVVVRDGRLQISRVQPSHAGQYSCTAQNSVSDARKEFLLLIQVAPSILGSEISSERNIQEKREVTLECKAEGTPAPQILWLKDGKPLDPSSVLNNQISQDGSSLILKSAQTSDSGRYTCLARNDAGEDTKVFVLNILVPPAFESGSNVSETLSSVPGGQVTLECHASGSLPMQLTWLKDGHKLPASRYLRIASGGRILRISQVQVSDAGTYTCVASSPAGAAEKSFILHIESLPVLERSESTEEVTALGGAAVTFTCEAHGTPLPSLSWEKDGEPLHLQSNLLPNGLGTRLHLESVHAEDSGLYSCSAVNPAGKVSKHFRLSVLEPPKIEGSAQPTEVSVVADDPLQLVCNAAGLPIPDITWEKDGRPLSQPSLLTRDGTVLRIERVKAEDAGIYVCVATSTAGRDSKATWVRMKGDVFPVVQEYYV
ncbi:hypothetical protein FKM82_005546 [Ascaphus truei]